jgi:serine/threonine protein kinase
MHYQKTTSLYSHFVSAKLGSGAFGTVHMAKARDTGKAYAVKIINRAALTTNLEYALKQEISILNELDHPDILRLVSTFSTPESHYLVTELLEGDFIAMFRCYGIAARLSLTVALCSDLHLSRRRALRSNLRKDEV